MLCDIYVCRTYTAQNLGHYQGQLPVLSSTQVCLSYLAKVLCSANTSVLECLYICKL